MNHIYKTILQNSDKNNNIDLPSVLAKLSLDSDIFKPFQGKPYDEIISEFEQLGENAYHDNLGNYKTEIQKNIYTLDQTNQLPSDNSFILNHCKWLFGTMLDMSLFLKTDLYPKKFPAIKYTNFEVVEKYYNRKGIILLGVYQNHIGFFLDKFLKTHTLSIVSKGEYSNDSFFLGNFKSSVNIIAADNNGGKKIYSELKNNKVIGVYNDYLYPDARGANGILFGNHVPVSETLIRIAEMTNSVIIPISILKEKTMGEQEVEVKFYNPIDLKTSKENLLGNVYKVSLATELLIRTCPYQWRLWNTLNHRWNQVNKQKLSNQN